MRKLISTFALAGILGMSAVSASTAAPVPGFEALYTSTFTACTLPAGTLAECEAAIGAYSGALVAAVEPTAANQSFIALRSEVFAGNAADTAFQSQIDALFETLLPDSGSVGSDLGNADQAPGTPS